MAAFAVEAEHPLNGIVPSVNRMTSEERCGSIQGRDVGPNPVAESETLRPLQSSAASMRSSRSRYRFFRRRRDEPSGLDETSSITESNEPFSARPQERPSYAMSTFSARSRLWRGESWRASIRSSFMGRRKVKGNVETPPASSESDRAISSHAQDSPERFKSADEYYRHLRMRSISRPLGFQHIDGNAELRLRPLEPVQEIETSTPLDSTEQSEESAEGAHQQKRKRHHREASITQTPLILSRPISPMFQEFEDMPKHLIVQSRHDSRVADGRKSAEESEAPAGQDDLQAERVTPGQQTTQQALYDQHHEPRLPDVESSVSPLEIRKADSQNQLLLVSPLEVRKAQPHTEPLVEQSINMPNDHTCVMSNPREPEITTAEEEASSSLNHTTSDWLPTATTSVQPSVGIISDDLPVTSTSTDGEPSVASVRSSKSSNFILQPSGVSISSIEDSQPHPASEATWEDDVDFCYQQQAESTCDFDWHFDVEAERNTAACEEVVASYMPYSIPGSSSPTPTESGVIGAHATSHPSIPRLTPSQESTGRVQKAAVGYRGFAAARSKSKGKASKSQPPTAFNFTLEPLTPSGPLSPVYSIAGDVNKSLPTTPEITASPQVEEYKLGTPSRPPALPVKELIGLPEAFLMSPKSSPTSPRQRRRERSSSRSSRGWSLASITSVPELVSSGRKHRDRSSVSKASISLPLMSLPSPTLGGDKGTADHLPDSTIVPRDMQNLPMRSVFTIRRPETSSDRAVLQAAGRASQRGRPLSPTIAQHGYTSMLPELREQGDASSLTWV